MAAAGKETAAPKLTPLNFEYSEKPDKTPRAMDKQSSIPVPPRGSNATTLFSKQQPPVLPSSGPKPQAQHRFLTPAEWAQVAHGLGAIRDGGGESHTVAHPTCWYWPPKGLPDGLYRDVIFEKTTNYIQYHALGVVHWFLMIVQIVLGAILTALGSMALKDGTPITILAALNTVDAGLLALMHNSGLPDRYRLNKVEFSKVEDHLRQLLDTGIIEHGKTIDELLADCFERYHTAKATVLANLPASYVPSQGKPSTPSSSTSTQNVPPAH